MHLPVIMQQFFSQGNVEKFCPPSNLYWAMEDPRSHERPVGERHHVAGSPGGRPPVAGRHRLGNLWEGVSTRKLIRRAGHARRKGITFW